MGQAYLVIYDYEMGGLWAVVTADSADEIVRRFPELTVVSDRPAWLDDEQYERLELDDPTSFLEDIVEQRPRDERKASADQ